ncbi:CDGSH iron-sulfur domain-containing protein [Thiothrix nivea]|uniref:Iron sulfur domain-containing, CDGSH-type n=1 Tax=Thiothrix nivea (strain ATCC 35100 / DSM 5205 / JP2) TaxID=870187 RepID=A0A656H9P7_THINJ|nr:CDGSH iron-sulfur domain-containing protein [Thiothrix nivea]EIJ32887.1 Iron sulfur domain-containing, CDGSH-type [Thiothrix nivea DSM 5205]
MTEPVIAQKKPCVMELEPGTRYWWCACGRSANQPFCDGSHAGTSIEPLEFTVPEKKKYGLCACKHTRNAPFCDATHRNLD